MSLASVPRMAMVFDFDGTLVDSIELILESYRHTLRVHRGQVPPDSVWLEGLGTPLRVQFRHFTDDPTEVQAMIKDGTISGGMIPKVEACIKAVESGAASAHMLDGRIPHVLLLELFTDAGIGTMILKDPVTNEGRA